MQRKYFFVLATIVISMLSWHHMIYQSDSLPSFTADEVANTQAAISFFENGRYQNLRYGLVYSSDIAVTWPSAVGWYLGKSMLASRLGCAFFSWIFALFLGFRFFRSEGYSRINSITVSVCLWAFMITSPFAMPYWFGFIYNLGELNSIILIGFGLLMITKNPFFSAFMFGVAVWHGKYIYFPFVFSILLGNLLVQKLSARQTIITAGRYAIIFVLPLLIWLGWIGLRGDVVTVKQWLLTQFEWLDQMKKMHGQSPLSAAKISPLGLWERLKSPELEWVGYSMGTKAKDLLFSFGAIGLTIASLIAVRIKKLYISERGIGFSLMAVATIGFYSVWYFFIHQYMWQRHFQPALYIGFGLFVFWGSKWAGRYFVYLRPVFYMATILLLAVQVMNGVKHPFFQTQPSYARLCTGLYSLQCAPVDK